MEGNPQRIFYFQCFSRGKPASEGEAEKKWRDSDGRETQCHEKYHRGELGPRRRFHAGGGRRLLRSVRHVHVHPRPLFRLDRCRIPGPCREPLRHRGPGLPSLRAHRLFSLYYFDWLQSGALVGLWAVFVRSATGSFIGACLDLATAFTSHFRSAARAITAGAVMQTATFFKILLGFPFLYHPTAAGVGHPHCFNREWFFTLS
jgi:hypothetical protein